jgi:hypothetical protein
MRLHKDDFRLSTCAVTPPCGLYRCLFCLQKPAPESGMNHGTPIRHDGDTTEGRRNEDISPSVSVYFSWHVCRFYLEVEMCVAQQIVHGSNQDGHYLRLGGLQSPYSNSTLGNLGELDLRNQGASKLIYSRYPYEYEWTCK